MVLQNELKDASRIPLKDRLAWTIPQAASLYGIDYDGLRQAVNQGDIDTFRPPSKRGTPSRRQLANVPDNVLAEQLFERETAA